MCEATSAAIAISLIGTGLQVANSMSEGDAAHAQAFNNQNLARQAASDALLRGQREAQQLRGETSQLINRQRVAYANSGVDPTVGTPLAVMADTRAMGELDARIAENNAAREAWGFRRYGIAYGQQAQLESTRTQYRVAGTLLGGGAQVTGYLAHANASPKVS